MAKSDSPYLTTGERIRSFLGWAFIISLVAHLIFGPLIPFSQTHAEEQQTEQVSVTKKAKVKVPTPPPPTPTPRPTQQPKTTPPPKKQPQQTQPKLKIAPPKTTSNGAGPSQNKYVAPAQGSQNGVPAGTATSAPAGTGKVASTPASTATPPPSCAVPNAAATTTNAVTPEYPEQAKEAGINQQVTVIVRVQLDASGSLTSASILQSGGPGGFDNAALLAARQSSYKAEVANCKPVPGEYTFRAVFDPSS